MISIMARKTYTDEFRRQAVDLYEQTGAATLSGIAGDLGLARGTLAAWVITFGRGPLAAAGSTPAAARGSSPGPDSGRAESQAVKLARLEARVRELEAETTKLTTEREILRSAAKYFAGETIW